ncbi:MAG: hypothetical protein HRU00_04355 [Myxococcales bacterium]|nr:hypothetical protein [Myxococcales bacterium]
MRAVFLLYALSGFVSLGYQVAWYRIYVDRFGSTNLTFVLVLCSFIGGLGAGALISRRLTDRLRSLGLVDGLRAYGALEICVTASILLTGLAGLIPADTWGVFPYQLSDGIYTQTWSYQFSEFAIAAGTVFVPCLFMGATFPLLCDVYRGQSGADSFPSALYAWNTFGAASAVLVCQFVLLPSIGHDRTLWLMAGLNLLIGSFFLLRGGAPARPEASAEPTAPAGVPIGPKSVLLTAAVLGGFLTGALEGDAFKRINFIAGNSSMALPLISFWAILGIFLGSATVRALPALRLTHIKIAFVLAAVLYAGVWYYINPIIDWLLVRSLAGLAGGVEVAFPADMASLLAVVGLMIFPPFLLISLLLPYVCNRIQGQRRHLGLAYGLNTLAFCVGTVAFTWIAPLVSVFYSMKLAMLLLGLGALYLIAISERRPVPSWAPLVGVCALAVAAFLIPRGFDASYVNPGSPAARFPVRALKSNGAHTTYVVASPQGDILFFDNHAMSAAVMAGQIYMRLHAHFPLLAQKNPSRALLIGFGVGNTASAIAAHDTIRTLDVVELNTNVIETAPEFERTNGNVQLDPRVRFILDDGRNFLSHTDATYDLITSEPPPPMRTGIYRLYSKEYYEQVLAHLSPGGMMSQWVPIDQMPPQAVDLVVRTFVDVFPYSLLLAGYREQFILVGSPSPIELGTFEERFGESKAVVADLRRILIRSPLSLVARVVKGHEQLRREYREGRLISDQHNDLSHLFVSPLEPSQISYDPFEVLDDIGAEKFEMADRLKAVVTHQGRLRYHVRGFPAGSLASVRDSDRAGSVQLAGVDWRGLDRILAAAESLRAAGREADALALLSRAVAVAPEQPDLLLVIAQLQFRARQPQAALEPIRRFQAIEPEEPIGFVLEGLALIDTGRSQQAIPPLERALELDPSDKSAAALLAKARARAGSAGSAGTENAENTPEPSP